VLILILVAVPSIVALLLWAITDLEGFVLVAVLSAIVFPASLAKPFGTNIDAADILLLIALASWLISNSIGHAPDPWIRGNALMPAVGAYLAVTAISIAWSIKPRSTIIFTVQLIELIIAYPIIMATIPRSIAKIRRSLLLLVTLTTAQAIAAIAVFFANPSSQSSGTYLPGINKNALGCFTAAGAVIGYAIWLRTKPGPARVLLLFAVTLCAFGTIATGSRGAMLGAAVAILVTSVLLGQRWVVGLGIAAIGAAVFALFVAPQEASKTSVAGSYSSASIRDVSWKDGVKYIENHPWLGTGARTYLDDPEGIGIIPDPNNLFLLTWAELGIPGLVALGFLLFRFATLLVRAKRLPDDAAAIAVGAGGVAISLLVHFQVDISWVRGETTLEFAMIGLMLAVIRLASAEVDRAEKSAALAESLQSDPVDELIPAGVT
jgi:O-antigen ligase